MQQSVALVPHDAATYSPGLWPVLMLTQSQKLGNMLEQLLSCCFELVPEIGLQPGRVGNYKHNICWLLLSKKGVTSVVTR